MDKTLQEIGAGVVRHGLTTAGGALVTQGVLHSQSDVQAFVGAGMVIVGIAWSWWQKVGAAKATAELQAIVAMLRAARKK